MKLQNASRWLIALAVAAGATAGLRAEILDRVLAIVAGEMITLTDVTAARDFALVDVPPASDAARDILPRLIDRVLILAEVDRYAPPEPGAEALEAEVRARRERFATEEAFQGAMARSGINERGLREWLRQDLRIRAYLDQRFAGDQRTAVLGAWVAGLRQRSDIVDLSVRPR